MPRDRAFQIDGLTAREESKVRSPQSLRRHAHFERFGRGFVEFGNGKADAVDGDGVPEMDVAEHDVAVTDGKRDTVAAGLGGI